MVALPRDPANIGRQYGRLTVEAFAPPSYRGVRVHCVCECGNRTEVQLSSLRLGHTKSCGCLQKEFARVARPRRATPPPPPPLAVECECGNAKSTSEDEACPRCTWLDGKGFEMALISALRVLGEVATMAALVGEMGACERTVFRGLAVLQSTGRVESFDLGRGEAEEMRFRYVPGDDSGKNAFRSGRAGYYVVSRLPTGRRKGGKGHLALYVLKNTRRAG